MATKKTYIGVDEELIVQGNLRIEGNVTQLEQTNVITINNFEGNSLVINSDSDNTTAILSLNSNGVLGNISFEHANGSIVFNKPVNLGSSTLTANVVGNVTGNVTGFVSSISNFTTTNLAEGSSLYFTAARVRGNISVTDTGGDGSLTYNNTTGVITYTGPNQTEANARITAAPTQVRAHLSATDAGGDGSFSYNNGTGVFTYTGPSATETRAHFSASNGVDYNSATGAFQAVESEIQHDSLDGFVANEHIDHSTVSITAGAGLTGGGTIAATRTINVGAGDGISVAADSVAVDSTVVRTSGTQTIGGNKTFTGTTTVSADVVPSSANTINLGSWANHFGYVFANVLHAEYLDLSDANIADIHNRFVAGSVSAPLLSTNTAGGLTYTHNATIAGYSVSTGDGLQISGTNVAVNSTVVRTSGTQTIGGSKTFSSDLQVQGNLNVTGNINSLTQIDLFVEDNNITLRSGAVGGGDAHVLVERGSAGTDSYLKYNETSDRWQFSNNGTTANNMLLLTDLSVTDLGGDGSLSYNNSTGVITYTGPSATEVRAHFNAGTGITITGGSIATNDSQIVHDNLSGFVANEHIDHSTVSITAGTGLTGGGTIAATRTINVVGGDGIIANANDIQVDSTVIRTTGDQSLAGTKTFTGTLVAPSSSATANGAIYYDNVAGKAYIYVGGVAREITPAVDAGDVEDVGADGINIYAGTRVSGNTTLHGIKSINSGTYTTISETSNVITVAGNITAIRGAFGVTNASGFGSLAYTPATGTIQYTGVSTNDIRGLFSASGLISYNGTTGAFTTTADNYSNWKFDTDTGSAQTISSGNTVRITGGTGIDVTHVGSNITIAVDSDADISAVTAGAGLTGGGVSGAVTLNVGAGTGITVNADNIAVNMSAFTTTNLNEGTSLYYTDARVNSFIQANITTSDIDEGSRLYYTQARANAAFDARLATSTTANLSEDTNLYFTAARVRGNISVTDSGGDGSLTYNNTTGIITYTGPSQAEANTRIDARLSGGTGIGYSSGVISLSHLGIQNLADPNADRIVFWDDSAGATAWLTAGNYISISGTSLNVDATTTNTASKVVARDASGNFAAGVITATATQAYYADLAENYKADADYAPGTVLVFGGREEVTACVDHESTKVAGVVTTNPAHVMNTGLTAPHVACIALRGRVPVLVKGVVRKGDVLVTAGEGFVGYAVASITPREVPAASVIGKAIGDKLDAGIGVIEVLI